jgi:Protein of unknown function (DUF692)
MTEAKTSIPEPRQQFGAGYLYHYHPKYQDFAPRLEAVGGYADIYEILGIQFNSEPDALEPFTQSLGKPITLHSFESCLGNVDRPPKKTLDRISNFARLSKAVYIGEHIAFMGNKELYAGGFIQPPGTDEQNQVLIDNVKAAQASSPCPIILENASQFFNQIGPHSISQQLRDVALGANAGILLSLSNITISERFRPQDRDAFLADIPMRQVRQIHALCGNEAEERMPGMDRSRREQEWIINTMQELAKNPELRPASVIFELEAGTSAMAEPERLRDFMQMARDLFFQQPAAAAAPAAMPKKTGAKG